MPASNNRKCQLETCDRKHHGNGWCEKHNRQVSQHGHILTSKDISAHMKANRAKRKNWYGWSGEAKQRNVGKQTGIRKNTGRTHFKKGFTPWNKGKEIWALKGHNHGFKKGHTPWNKGLQNGMPVPWNKIGEGITAQSRLERVTFQKTMQQLVFQRDDYTCQNCQQEGGYLQVDHIKGWAEYSELRFDINNCRTLCMACHYYVTFKRKIPKGIIWGHNLSRRIEP